MATLPFDRVSNLDTMMCRYQNLEINGLLLKSRHGHLTRGQVAKQVLPRMPHWTAAVCHQGCL